MLHDQAVAPFFGGSGAQLRFRTGHPRPLGLELAALPGDRDLQLSFCNRHLGFGLLHGPGEPRQGIHLRQQLTGLHPGTFLHQESPEAHLRPGRCRGRRHHIEHFPHRLEPAERCHRGERSAQCLLSLTIAGQALRTLLP